MVPSMADPAGPDVQDLLDSFEEDPLLHWLLPSCQSVSTKCNNLRFPIREGGVELEGVDALVNVSARAVHPPSPSVGPSWPGRSLVRKILATCITKEVVRRVLAVGVEMDKFNSIDRAVSSRPAAGVLSGIDRSATPAYRNVSLQAPGAFGESSVRAVRSAVHHCNTAAGGFVTNLIVSSPDTLDSVMKSMDARDRIIMYQVRDGIEIHPALCFGGACWVPMSAYPDHDSCRVLTLEDISLYVGETTTATDLRFPISSIAARFTVASSSIQLAFPRLSTHAAVGGWILE